LADKYVQADLREKCLDFLTSILNMENVYTILDFAHKENLPLMKNWCLACFKNKVGEENIAGLIQYLATRQEDHEFNKEISKFALNFVLDNFFEIYEKGKDNIQIYEDFFLKSIEMKTIPRLANLLGRESYILEKEKDWYNQERSEEINNARREVIRKSLPNLKEAVLSFVEENAEIIMTSKVSKGFSNEFLKDFILFTTKTLSNVKAELKNVKKRMEPNQNDLNKEENSHELKKTKKSEE